MIVFEKIFHKLKQKNNESLKMSINHCHVKDMFSLVVDGNEFGQLTRVFIAGKKIKPFEVQLHTHRYPIRISILKGNITHHQAVKDTNGSVKLSEYSYESPITGGKGLEYVGETTVNCSDHKLPIGSCTSLAAEDYHTISCSKNSIWVVEELAYKTQKSSVLGMPFSVNNLYLTPDASLINEKCQLLIAELQEFMQAYKH